jgi:hypothetical protein
MVMKGAVVRNAMPSGVVDTAAASDPQMIIISTVRAFRHANLIREPHIVFSEFISKNDAS